MRIVTYHPRARVGDGGITNSVRRLNAEWAAMGVEAVIAYDGAPGSGRQDAGVRWSPVRHVGRGRARVAVAPGRTFEGADVLILNSAWSPANLVAGRAARHRQIPYVLAPRGAYDPLIVARRGLLKQVWWRLEERRLADGAAAIHVFFGSQGSHLERLGLSSPLVVAPNGVDVPPGLRWDGGSGGYVLYLGRFDPEHKGLDLLVRAMASLPAGERPPLRMYGPDWRGGKRRVTELVERLDLEGDVVLGEPIYGARKWELISRAQAFVYPSRWEGFGNSLAEAAALGVPCLATPYPLAEHLQRHGACIVAPATVEGLRLGLVQVTASSIADIGRRAVEVTAERFTWTSVARSWLDQLGEVAADAGPGPTATR